MSRVNPVHLILIGLFLMVLGVILAYLMLPSVNVLESSFPLNFLTYAIQISGLFLGVIGTAYYVRLRRK